MCHNFEILKLPWCLFFGTKHCIINALQNLKQILWKKIYVTCNFIVLPKPNGTRNELNTLEGYYWSSQKTRQKNFWSNLFTHEQDQCVSIYNIPRDRNLQLICHIHCIQNSILHVKWWMITLLGIKMTHVKTTLVTAQIISHQLKHGLAASCKNEGDQDVQVTLAAQFPKSEQIKHFSCIGMYTNIHENFCPPQVYAEEYILIYHMSISPWEQDFPSLIHTISCQIGTACISMSISSLDGHFARVLFLIHILFHVLYSSSWVLWIWAVVVGWYKTFCSSCHKQLWRRWSLMILPGFLSLAPQCDLLRKINMLLVPNRVINAGESVQNKDKVCENWKKKTVSIISCYNLIFPATSYYIKSSL